MGDQVICQPARPPPEVLLSQELVDVPQYFRYPHAFSGRRAVLLIVAGIAMAA